MRTAFTSLASNLSRPAARLSSSAPRQSFFSRNSSTISVFGQGINIIPDLRAKSFMVSGKALDQKAETLNVLNAVREEMKSQLQQKPDENFRIILVGHGHYGAVTIGSQFYPPGFIAYLNQDEELQKVKMRFFIVACKIGYGVGVASQTNTINPDLVQQYHAVLNKNTDVVLCGDENDSTTDMMEIFIRHIIEGKNFSDFEHIAFCLRMPMPFKVLISGKTAPEVFEHQLFAPKSPQDLNHEKCRQHVISQVKNFAEFYKNYNFADQREMRTELEHFTEYSKTIDLQQYLRYNFLLHLSNHNSRVISIYYENENKDPLRALLDSDSQMYYLKAMVNVLFKLCDEGKIDGIEKMMEGGLGVDIRNSEGFNMLWMAYQKGNLELFDFLLLNNSNPHLPHIILFEGKEMLYNILDKFVLDFNDEKEPLKSVHLKMVDSIICSNKFTLDSESFRKGFKSIVGNSPEQEKYQDALEYVASRIDFLKPKPKTVVADSRSMVENHNIQR
ncbi:MAG: hypothetical protein V4612_04380 [Pseudomonadota bacterium]